MTRLDHRFQAGGLEIAPLRWIDEGGVETAATAIGTFVAARHYGRVELIVGYPRSGMIVLWRHDEPGRDLPELKRLASEKLRALVFECIVVIGGTA